MMTFKIQKLTCLALAAAIAVNAETSFCTTGRLFLSDNDSNQIRVYETDGSPSFLNSVDAKGDAPQFVMTSASGRIVSSVYRGVEDQNYTDGTVSFIESGVEPSVHSVAGFELNKVDPTTVSESISCARPIHYVTSSHRIAFFCDGSFEGNVNSTVWVVDERNIAKQQSTKSAIVYTETLQGSHHGVCVPVDEDHVLVSVPLPGRVVGDLEASALPSGFEVRDYDGNFLHGLNEEEDPAKSCTGFHGSGIVDNTFVFACDADHGGILIVDYGQVVTYASRKLSYPEDYQTHRTGSLEEGPHGVIAGNFADRATGSYKMVAFDPKHQTSVITKDRVLDLPAGQCSFKFELSGTSDSILLAWMPTGNLLVYSVTPEWTLIADISLFDDMESCTDTLMIPGHGHAYVVRGMEMFDVDLSDLALFLAPTQLTLDFMPASGTVAGVPSGYSCPTITTPDEPKTHTTSVYTELEVSSTNQQSRVLQETLKQFRRALAQELQLPLNRVYLGQLEPLTDTSLLVEVKVSEPGPLDTMQISSKDIVKQMTGADFGTASFQQDKRMLISDASPAAKLSFAATIAIVAVGFVGVLSSALAVSFYKREKEARCELEMMKTGTTA